METIVTRFPPSPTGYLHVGGARTALFNWLYARQNNGKFVLRIEDTDTVRSTQASVDAIFEAMEWLELDWDEGPFSKPSGLNSTGNTSEAAGFGGCLLLHLHATGGGGHAPKGHGRRRQTQIRRPLPRTRPGQVGQRRDSFQVAACGTTVVEDVIKGDIVFQNTEQDDFVICRSDGTPTYNFVVVVDDITMGINTVIRGDDHVMNTPKQILLYKALQSPLPVFGHVPMVLGKDKTRLSKRHGAMSVTAYRDMGYLPDAFINYLARLGWSHGDQEFFTRQELVEKFSLKNIGKSAGVFDTDKLTALNADHIRAASVGQLAARVLPLFRKRGYDAADDDYLAGIIGTLQSRSKTLKEMADGAHFYYRDDVRPYDEKAAKKFLKPEMARVLARLADDLDAAWMTWRKRPRKAPLNA
jgi:glutamyl-tRNA synthetase